MKVHDNAVSSLSQRFHRLQDLSEEWGLSLRELYREVAAGSLIVHRFGRSLRVSERDKQAYLAARRCVPAGADLKRAERRASGRTAYSGSADNSYREGTCK